MLTKGGVKLLDFGLARLRPTEGAAVTEKTITTPSITAREIASGTLPYMAPEQIEGAMGDARTDIFAFGAVLYEMASGRRAFRADSPSDLIVAILHQHPEPLASLQPMASGGLDRLIGKCLAKDPDARWQSASDLADELRWIAGGGGADAPVRDPSRQRRRTRSTETAIDARPVPASDIMAVAPVLSLGRRARWLGALPWAITATLAAALVVVLGRWAPWRTTSPRVQQRLSVELGIDGTLSMTDAAFALSPDGTLLAFVARTNGSATTRLHIRRLEQLTATPLPGTDEARGPFFSPDGREVAFFADLKLKRVPVAGGAVVTLADAPNPRGGWWAEDGTIVFAPNNRVGLMRVSAVGGQAQPLTMLADGEITHRWPQVLPGGAALLYSASTEVNIGGDTTLVVQPLPSGERTILHRGGYFGRYVASGHIVYMEDDTLFAMPFDRERLSVTGPAGRAIDGVRSDTSRGAAQFAVSQTGALAYLPGQNTFGARPIAWMDRTGAIAILRAALADWSNPEFSPDGQRIAIDIRSEGHSDIWVYDWARDTLTRVTSEKTNEERPVWTPDGERIVYRSFGSSIDPADDTLSWRRADGTGDAQVLIQSKAALVPGSWHPTQQVLAYVATTAAGREDVMILPIAGDEGRGWTPGQPTAFLNSAARERGPTFSPDGRWLAYYSNESGLLTSAGEALGDQVFVRPFPGPGSRVMVSSVKGATPSWIHARRELVFIFSSAIDYRSVLMLAPYRVENDSFLADKPRPWAERGSLRFLQGQRDYALHPDGERVAMAPPAEGEVGGQTHLTLVTNFFEELRRISLAKP